MEAVTDFVFLGSKITVNGHCSHEIKKCLLLGRKAMPNLNSIFKSRDMTLPTKVHLVKAMVFPVVMLLLSLLLSCLTLCDPMDYSTLGFPVHHQHVEFTQTHIHQVSATIQPSHLLLPPSLPAPDLSV